MRTVLIRIEGAKRRPIRKLQLHEGTRVSDILQELNVPKGFCLARALEPRKPFPQEAEVHSLITDAEYLVAHSISAAVENPTIFTLTFCNEEA